MVEASQAGLNAARNTSRLTAVARSKAKASTAKARMAKVQKVMRLKVPREVMPRVINPKCSALIVVARVTMLLIAGVPKAIQRESGLASP